MKFGQNVYLDEILDEFENGSCWVKTRSLGQSFEKPCVCSRDHNFSPIPMKLGKKVCLIKFRMSLKFGHVGVKN